MTVSRIPRGESEPPSPRPSVLYDLAMVAAIAGASVCAVVFVVALCLAVAAL